MSNKTMAIKILKDVLLLILNIERSSRYRVCYGNIERDLENIENIENHTIKVKCDI